MSVKRLVDTAASTILTARGFGCIYKRSFVLRGGSPEFNNYFKKQSLFPVSVRLCHNVSTEQPVVDNEMSVKNTVKDFQLGLRQMSMGKSIVERVLTEQIATSCPTASVSDVIAVTDSIIYLCSKLKRNETPQCFEDVLRKFGSQYLTENNMDNLRAEVNDYFQYDTEKFDHLIKLYYPKFMLMELLLKTTKDIHIKTTLTKTSNHSVTVGLFIDDKLVAEATNNSVSAAEKDVCRDFLMTNYEKEMANVNLPGPESRPLEEDIRFRDSPEQRKVKIIREGEENFGFFVRGGELEELTNAKYRKFYYNTLPYISKIEPGSPAHKSGKLEVGDVILSVGDYSTKGMSHRNIIKLIRNTGNSLVLTVISNPDVKIRDHLRIKDKERRIKKMKADVTPEKWREWHLAQAEKNPQKYITLIRELEKSKTDQ